MACSVWESFEAMAYMVIVIHYFPVDELKLISFISYQNPLKAPLRPIPILIPHLIQKV